MSEVEALKINSRGLRGAIPDEVKNDSDRFSEEASSLLKFHGSYQQDDRDLRVERRKQGLERAYIMMVRSKIPGGHLTSKQYLVHDRTADELGNGTIRITSRQGFQLHGVIKSNLKETIHRINECGLTTWGACGDVVRNVIATPWPISDSIHDEVRRLCVALKDHFSAHTTSYSEIWLNGEPLDLGQNQEVEEPIYGKAYLPRKFKIAVAIPPRNDVDILTNDAGLAPYVNANNEIEGYTVFAGGGMGMSHGKVETHPALAQPVFYVPKEYAIDAITAIVTTQRDYGNRENRKRARLKYLIEERGIEWFRNEVASRLDPKIPVSEAKEVVWETTSDMLGWHEQGNGKLFCSIWVPEGRIKDYSEGKYKSCFQEIAQRFDFPIRLTLNCNLLFFDIEPSQKEEIDAILKKHGVSHADHFTEARKVCQACVALPTCGLALAESERVFGGVMDEIDKILFEMKLENEPLLVRMTGCPNGCARPYNADFAFVGRGPGRYAFFVGGSYTGERLAYLMEHTVKLEEIPHTVRKYLQEFIENREPEETFSHYWGRTHMIGESARPEQFHEELSKLREAAGLIGE